MKKLLFVLLSLLFITTSSWAGGQMTLVTPDGQVFGTPDHPLVVTGGGSVSDTAYSAAWNGDTTTAASKNALYDKIETIVAGGLDFALDSTTSGNVVFVGCTDSIQTAIDAAASGDTLILGSCDYTISTGLTIAQPITIRGQGIDSTRLVVGSEIIAITAVDVNNVRFFDFSIYGTDLGAQTIHVRGLTASVSGTVLKNIKVTGTVDDGTNGITLTNSSSYLENVYVDILDTSVSGSNQVRAISLNYTAACSEAMNTYTRNVYSRASTSTTATGGSQQIRGIMQYVGNPVCHYAITHVHDNGVFIADNLDEFNNSATTNAMHAQGGTNAGVTVIVRNSILDGGDGNQNSNTKNIDLRCDDGSTSCVLINTSLRNNSKQNQGTATISYDRAGVLYTGGIVGAFSEKANRYSTAAPMIKITGQEGGNESQAGTRTARTGGYVTLTGGLGGYVTSKDAGTKTGGSGGGFTLTGGVGGTQSSDAATNVGGTGGGFVFTGGVGGDATNGTSTNTGGNGGSHFYAGGTAGTGATANGRNGTVNIGSTDDTTSQGYVKISYNKITIAADDTTPDVRYSSWFVTSANSGATAITDLDNPTVGQTVCIYGGSSTNASTIADSGNFKLTAAMTLNLYSNICLYVVADNNYMEISRSVN